VLYVLGARLAHVRASEGFTQRELADLIGVHLGTLRLYEQGLRNPPIEALVRIAHYCRVSLSALLSPLDEYDVHKLGVRVPKKRRRAS